jgi:hypothetical protein
MVDIFMETAEHRSSTIYSDAAQARRVGRAGIAIVCVLAAPSSSVEAQREDRAN